ncbi:MAG TPA: hypothetical protein VIQ54_02485, partial [Polyangia bacterium]
MRFDASTNGKNGNNGHDKNGHTNGNGHGVAPEVMRAIADEFNAMVALNETLASEMVRVERVVGREGRMTERAG